MAKQTAKPSGSNGRNNGSHAQEINKWALKRQVGLKTRKERNSIPWAVYDIEK